jgi:hypothetical protein
MVFATDRHRWQSGVDIVSQYRFSLVNALLMMDNDSTLPFLPRIRRAGTNEKACNAEHIY